ncbi:MAG: cell division protein FtsL [Alphaproteobacteria bacterium]|nr:cell division protein FtsL [Alphaproteobacteria bacterium]
MRILLTLAVIATLGSAFTLYAVNYETRAIAEDVKRKVRAIEKAQHDISILKAERAHLARPERIAKYARELGLVPAKRGQFAGYSEPDPLKPQSMK